MKAPPFLSRFSTVESPDSATVTLAVGGMKCAGCVQVVEKQLAQQVGVEASVVNLVTQQAQVEYQPEIVAPADLAATLTAAGFPSTVHQETYPDTPEFSLDAERQRHWLTQLQQLLMAGGLVLVSSLGHLAEIPGIQLPDTAVWQGLSSMWLHWGLATLALVGPGRSILIDGWLGFKRWAPTMNSLVGLGTVTAYGASVVALVWPGLHWDCFFDAPVMVVGLILLGRTLEDYARGRATAALEALLALRPLKAHVLLPTDGAGDQTVEVPIEQVQQGTQVRVFPGDQFPVDGEIVAGQTLVNQAMLTGESLPVAKGIGDEVTAGTLNQSGAVTVTVTRIGAETTLAKIIDLVTAAQTRKAPIQRVADVVAGYFTYGVLAIATLTFAFWALVGPRLWPALVVPTGHMMGAMDDLAGMTSTSTAGVLLGVKLAIAVLVVACPCALGLATPTAILVGTSLGAEQGLLIRGGDVLEQVHTVDTVVFDKTGTLTTGQPTVTEFWVTGSMDDGSFWQRIASTEAGVRHPLATAILEQAHALGIRLLEAEDERVIPGCGVQARVAGESVVLGTQAWFEQLGVAIPAADQERAQRLAVQGHTISYVAIADQYCGAVAIRDQLKPDAVATVTKLRQMGLQVRVLTGDSHGAAVAIAQALGLDADAVQAEVLPAEKAAAIAQLQSEKFKVAMVGDGINDAPALAQADVGIALSSGTDVAVETAQIVLMRGEQASQLMDVVSAIELSRATFRKIQQNLFWAFAYNCLGIPVAAGLLLPQFGILVSPAAAAAIMAFSSVSVVTNALSLRLTVSPS